MRTERSILAGILVAAVATLLGGCAHLGAEPWEREVLAAPGMAVDPAPVETALNEHIQFSREASSGGIGTAGGGCGCN